MGNKSAARLTSNLLARKGNAQPFSAADVFSLPPQTVVNPAVETDEQAVGRRLHSDEWPSSPATSDPAIANPDVSGPAAAPASPLAEKAATTERPWSRASVLGALEKASELHPAADDDGAARASAPAQPAPARVAQRTARAESRCGTPHALPMAAGDAKGRVALTLRVDHDRHVRLRLLAAQTSRSSQDILMAALDNYIIDISEKQDLCDCLKPKSHCGKTGLTAG